jgi:PAS domain S-box-containing protein
MRRADQPSSSPSEADALIQGYQQRIRELEARLEESEDTLEAIRRGDVDAVVVGGREDQHRVYTLENADRPYRVLIEQIQEGAVTLGSDGTVLYCNRRLAEMLGMPQERVIGQALHYYIAPGEEAAFTRLLADAQHVGARAELVIRTAEGVHVPVYLSLSPLRRDDGAALLCGVLTDLTQQKLHLRELAEANARLVAESTERERVEDALRQSQKMEAVGQLTGGIAHDFNNLLQGITGSLDLVQRRIAQGRTGEIDRLISGAMTSANRAAALTHRLLAFSRRQPLDPKPVHANPLVASMEDLLRRTMGEAIQLELVLAGGLWLTLCDPNQLESAVLNLVINARDAMAQPSPGSAHEAGARPGGGRLTIETCNAHLDSAYVARTRGVSPGQYVCICVTDTGTGMSAEVAERAFDPFFTTKPTGQGTGLGLSMIYGFARQSEGTCKIYSEVGRGTTVKLYLPRYRGETVEDEQVPGLTEAHEAGDDEVVLVVEDDPVVRALVVEVLRELGYRALEVEDGTSGLEVLRSRQRIDLLITDIGLPGLNGRQMADAARESRPGLKVLFMTGYAENAAIANGFLDPGMAMITKPFAMEVLATRIRGMIEADRRR